LGAVKLLLRPSWLTDEPAKMASGCRVVELLLLPVVLLLLDQASIMIAPTASART
jgi:hypothetical protein